MKKNRDRRLYSRQRYQADPEKYRAKTQAWRAANPEKVRAQRERATEHKATGRKARVLHFLHQRKYFCAECQASAIPLPVSRCPRCKRLKAEQQRRNNPGGVRRSQRAYYQRNKKVINAKTTEWMKQNKDRVNENTRKRRAANKEHERAKKYRNKYGEMAGVRMALCDLHRVINGKRGSLHIAYRDF